MENIHALFIEPKFHDSIKTNIEWAKNMEDMLAKSENLIKHHDSMIKQQAESYKELQYKVASKNKKIEELKETILKKDMPSN